VTPRPARKLRCAVYTRKSSEEGLELEFNSLHAQREAGLAYIASQRSEGWLALKTTPPSWATAGPTTDGLLNFFQAGPGLGSGRRPERLLDNVRDVTPLRATALERLVGQRICAVVYDGDVSINYGPLSGSLKGANLGVVAFEVLTVSRLTGYGWGLERKTWLLDHELRFSGVLASSQPPPAAAGSSS
jgi:hypothetical protein